MSYDPVYQKAYWERNKERLTKQRKARYEANKDKLRDYYKGKKRDYRKKDIASRLFLCAKTRAKRKGLLFTITKSDIIIPELCPYLGVKLTDNSSTAGCQFNPSIDRIDPSKGYTPDNIEIISYLANAMKYNAKPEQLVKFAEEVLRRYK